jgi:hypothetical protein
MAIGGSESLSTPLLDFVDLLTNCSKSTFLTPTHMATPLKFDPMPMYGYTIQDA